MGWAESGKVGNRKERKERKEEGFFINGFEACAGRATFDYRMSLPYPQSPADIAKRHMSFEVGTQVEGRRVLIVEDQSVAALSLRTILTAEGRRVDIAESAERALAMFKASPYDLVVTDFKLAEMNGLQLAAEIKLLSPTTPVFLVTAFIEQFTGRPPNIDLLLGKPFSVVDLQSAVRKVFGTPN